MQPNFIDLTGHTFGNITVLSRANNNISGSTQWNCQCSCGKKWTVLGQTLRLGGTMSCGGQHSKVQNLLGFKYGKLTVEKSLGVKPPGRGQTVQCRCDCGGSWIGKAYLLKRGNTRSCGCLKTGPAPTSDKTLQPIKRLLGKYKRSAKNRSLTWNLDDTLFRTLIVSACFYCGAAPCGICRDRAGSLVKYNGIDRQNNNLGYDPGNVVSCCATCNYMKSAWTEEEFLNHVKKITSWQKNVT
jgi:hypothetical protein